MRHSMTGFASVQGGLSQPEIAAPETADDSRATAQLGELSWTWEIRGVNAKGLDIRLRLPERIDGLEPIIRKQVSARIARGNVQIGLRLQGGDTTSALSVDPNHLSVILQAMTHIETEALNMGLSLQPSNAAEIIALRGILTVEPADLNQPELTGAIMADFDAALDAFCQSRLSEGQALVAVLDGQLTQITNLVDQAQSLADARLGVQKDRLQKQVRILLDTADDLDETRLAQELALIAVKSDVTEEIDRLRAHVAAARDLMQVEGSVGRKMDFLMQEFNREANTLCSKSQNSALTQVGLSLKTVIDQMREQVQNVE